ncbi:MAG: hypothetical protein DSZ03_06445 [Sulfurimonas sp.]|nr:MAG: hypothetical protein DSZ03_06445 [Sulfurimonas sp.]
MILYRWLWLLLLVNMFIAPLYANDFIDDFIAEQIETEKKFLDQNLSSDAIEALIEVQHHAYRNFFLKLISQKQKLTPWRNPYADEIAVLQRRMVINQQRNNTKAYQRDAIKVATYKLLAHIRQTVYELIEATKYTDEIAFYKAVDTLIATRHEQEKRIDISAYRHLLSNREGNGMVQKIRENLLEYEAVLNVSNTFSSELVRYKKPIYDAIKLSSFGLISLGYKINSSALGELVNGMIAWSGLNSAKMVFIVLILLMAYGIRKLIVSLTSIILQNFFERSTDIAYIIQSVSRVLSLIMITVTLDIVLEIYAGFSEVLWLDRTFSIIYTVLITYLIHRLLNAVASVKMEHFRRSQYLRQEVINLALRVINVIIYFVGFIVILKLFDVDLSAILSGLGIGGFAVAFAAKDTIANFFGSVSILMGDLFEQGDWIEVDGYEGTVIEIGLRATTIRTFDNAMIAIPNFKLADNGLKNWSKRQLGRRIKMHIGVTYESDFQDIKNAVEQIRQMLIAHEGISNTNEALSHAERYAKLVSKEDYKGIKRNILVYMDRFSDSSIDILVYCFSKSVVWNEWLAVKEDVMYKIATILEQNHLSFAYPAMAIHYVNDEDEK